MLTDCETVQNRQLSNSHVGNQSPRRNKDPDTFSDFVSGLFSGGVGIPVMLEPHSHRQRALQ